MSVRQDFVDAYAAKWNCSPDYADAILGHVEIMYADSSQAARVQEMEERISKAPRLEPVEREGELWHLRRVVDRQVTYVELANAAAEVTAKGQAQAEKEIDDWKTREARARGACTQLLDVFGHGHGPIRAMIQAGKYDEAMDAIKAQLLNENS